MSLEQLKIAIDKLIQYNWDDELEDFAMNEESRPSHIFLDLVALDNFINGTVNRPEDYFRLEK